MASRNEPDQDVVPLEKRLQQLVASLSNEELGQVLAEVGRGKELDIARAMIQQVNKK